MRSCPHSLYDRNCRVDKAAYAQIATVDSLTGTSLAVGGLAGFADEWFSGGFLEWQIAAGVYERRGIERSTDDGSLLMFGTTDGITAGLTITAYPGCMRNIATCNTKFGNSDNYGGIPA